VISPPNISNNLEQNEENTFFVFRPVCGSLKQAPLPSRNNLYFLHMSSLNHSPTLAAWEVAIIDSFVRAVALVGLPRSIGEIYGCLYCSPEPLSFDAIADRLEISRGSVSGGLKTLRQLGAIKLQYVAGSRKDHFAPELSMERLVRGFIKDQFSPHLESSAHRLDAIEVQLAAEPDPLLRELGLQRLNTLRSWRRRAEKLLPLVLAVLGGGRALLAKEDEGWGVV